MGEGGVKNPEKLPALFMDGPLILVSSQKSPNPNISAPSVLSVS